MTEVLLVDDHASVRHSLRRALEARHIRVVGEAASGPAAVEEALRLVPDVVVMDVQMPQGDGIAAAREIVTQAPSVAVVLMTAFDVDDVVFRAIGAGATGFVLKLAGPDEIVRAVRAAARGEAALSTAVTRRVLARVSAPRADPTPRADLAVLTPGELVILRALCAGPTTNEAVGMRLSLSPRTVKSHLARIMAKLDIGSRAELVAWAFRAGVVS